MNEPLIKDHVYHFYNRGCNREPIFFNHGNYLYLLRKIKDTHLDYGVNILAYCLMPNHYHFLLQQITDRPISDWIRAIFNGYVQAVNKQTGRSGTLFQGRARHILVEREEYFVHVTRYIHLNPVEAGLVNHLHEWQFSNYAEWSGLRAGTLVDHDFVTTYFPEPDDYVSFVHDYSVSKEFARELEKYYLD